MTNTEFDIFEMIIILLSTCKNTATSSKKFMFSFIHSYEDE